MVGRARASASALVEALAPLAAAGIPIVGLEPACLFTLRDEALVMGLGDAARTVASQALLFEEFIAREFQAGRFSLELRAAEAPILVHGHCHQKAFGAAGPMLEVLRMIPGAAPELIESSCCGMAGSFGYEASHYDTSMKMAELSLLPAVRNAGADTLLVADGTSCRHQIADGTRADARMKAEHVARVLHRALAG